MHDSSEKIHEGTQEHNVTTTRILAAIEERKARISRQTMQRLPVAGTGEGEYSYLRESSGVGIYSRQDERGYGRQAGYAVEQRQSGFGRYPVGYSATK